MVKLVSLSSGSCGNVIFIEAGRTKVLIDAGTALNYMGRQLGLMGVKFEEIDAILLTHEHSDHIRSAAAVSRRFGVEVFGNAETLDALPAGFQRAHVRVFPTDHPFELGALTIKAIPHSHDSRAPVGFCVMYRDKKVCVATDLGRVTPVVKDALADADAIVIEANHDMEMLATGRYPRRLKDRIAGTRGHLSNVTAARTLAEVATGREQKVLLAHLSDENNTPQSALGTVRRILSDSGVDSIKIGLAPRLNPSAVLSI